MSKNCFLYLLTTIISNNQLRFLIIMPTNVYSHIDFACRQGIKRNYIAKLQIVTRPHTEYGFNPSSATARPPATMAEIVRFASQIGV